MVDARAHPTWVRFHTKVAGPERGQLLTEGVRMTRGAVLEELLEWTRVVEGEVSTCSSTIIRK
jgi:hypothetical protein